MCNWTAAAGQLWTPSQMRNFFRAQLAFVVKLEMCLFQVSSTKMIVKTEHKIGLFKNIQTCWSSNPFILNKMTAYDSNTKS